MIIAMFILHCFLKSRFFILSGYIELHFTLIQHLELNHTLKKSFFLKLLTN